MPGQEIVWHITLCKKKLNKKTKVSFELVQAGHGSQPQQTILVKSADLKIGISHT